MMNSRRVAANSRNVINVRWLKRPSTLCLSYAYSATLFEDARGLGLDNLQQCVIFFLRLAMGKRSR